MEGIREFYDGVFRVEDTESFIARSAPEWARYATWQRIRMAASGARSLARKHGARRLLDLGCGDGVALRYLNRLAPGLETVGADLSAVALAKAKSAGVRSPLVVCDANHLPFRDSSFELVLCTEVLEHVLDPGEMVRELSRVCTGSLVLSTPCFGPSRSKRYDGWADRWNSRIREVMSERGVSAMLEQTPILAGSSLHTGHVNAFTASRLTALIGEWFPSTRILGVYFNFPLLMFALQKRPQLAKYHDALQAMVLKRIPLFCTFVGGGDAVGNFEALVLATKPAAGA
jgi:SAM-dependent methyltransferase